MTTELDNIGRLLRSRRLVLGLTQAQLGAKIGVNKSEISKIERGRAITLSTIKKLSEALGVMPHLEFKRNVPVSRDVIHYIVMSVGMFGRKHNLTKKEACNYLFRFKGLAFTINHYEAEHQLSMQECVDDMTAICKRNGGAIS